MISLIAPAKTLDYESNLGTDIFSVSAHLNDSKILMKELQSKSPDDLSALMGLSEKLSLLNFERNMNWESPTKPSLVSRQAIYAFKGDVYMGLEAGSLNKKEIKYAQKHLAILSGLYGLLKPLDLIYPYRLEMGTKIQTSKGKNLYEFWGSKITDHLNTLLVDHKKKGVINLASVEYFSSVNPDELSGPCISPVFKDFKNGQFKIISFFAKKARGMMARYIIQNKVDSLEELKQFDNAGYKYSKKESTEFSPVFLRKN